MPKAKNKKSNIYNLKKEVYKLSSTKNTKSLKRSRVDFAKLDFRRKSSWELALNILQQGQTFDDFTNNPTEKYSELFKEIKQAAKDHELNLKNTNKVLENLDGSVKKLDKLTKEVNADAKSINENNDVAIPLINLERESSAND